MTKHAVGALVLVAAALLALGQAILGQQTDPGEIPKQAGTWSARPSPRRCLS